jgi:DNA-binding response OmpR family regulator
LHRRLGELLIELGVAPQPEVARLLPAPGRIASKLLAEGLATEAELVRALAFQQGVPGVDLSRSVIRTSGLELVPPSAARDQKLLPVEGDDRTLILVVANPRDRKAVEDLALATGREVRVHVALVGPLLEAIDAGQAALADGRSLLVGRRVEPARAREPHLAVVEGTDRPVDPLPGELPLIWGGDDEPLFPTVLPEINGTGAGRRILVVDDEPEICRLLERALTARGFTVEVARGGVEALHRIRSFLPDLVLLDAMLPEVHGFEICRKIKGSLRFSSVPVVITSAVHRGWRIAQDVKEAYGADDYVEKPFRLDDLVRRIEAVLAGANRPREDGAEAAQQAYREGIELLRAGQLPEARRAFERAVREDPLVPRFHVAAGRSAQEAGDDFGAIASYERAIELQPDLLDVLRALASLYTRHGLRRKAAEVWERAIAAAPDEATRAELRETLVELL